MFFITGNPNKIREAKSIIPDLEQLDIDLPEIQEIDARKIIEAKLNEALKHHEGPCIVEDTSLYLDALNGLPGPLIKWFLQAIGNDGLVQIAAKFGNNRATAKTVIGYAKNVNHIEYFEGIVTGTITEPRGTTSFGWDPIFQPDGYDQTFAQMSREEKNQISMRRKAFEALNNFLTHE